MDRNRVVTITELNLWTALTQANGFRCSENPLFQRGLSSPVLVHLLLPLLLLGAMSRLVVAGFEWLIVLLLVALLCLHTHSYRQLLLRVPGLDMGSSCAVFPHLIDSTYVHVGPSLLLLHVLFVGILLGGCIFHGA